MLRRLLLSASLVALVALTGSYTCAHAQASAGGTEYPDSRIDIYGGDGWFHPINSGIDGKQYRDITNPNATVSVSGYFNRFIGVQIEGSYFSGERQHAIYDPTCARSMCDQLIYTAEAGPVLRYPLGPFVPFIHILGGGERTNGPVDQHLFWGWGVTGGGGLDYILPFFAHRLAIRPIQADFQYSQVVYGPLVLPAGNVGGFGEIDALKLSGGLTLRLGNMTPPIPVSLGCSADPLSVFPGTPITVTASAMGLNPKHPVQYSWQSNGGKLAPQSETATVDTTGMAPGEYTVEGHVTQGPRAREQASCDAPFTVKALIPPSVSCTANPSSGVAGTTIQISASGVSPMNRPLTYSYSTTAGVITGTGGSAQLTTAGLGATNIIVTCNVADDLGQHSSAETTVTISTPVVPVVPSTQNLCSLSFTRDRRRPARVDNEAKACLDDIALTLTQQPDARLVIIGNSSPDETPNTAGERVLNARQYLVREKGIDSSRIDLRLGQTSGRTVDDVLVPSGASFFNPNTQTFDPSQIVRHGEAYGIHNGSAAPIFPHAHAHHYRRRYRRRTHTTAPPAGTTTPSNTSSSQPSTTIPALQ